MTQAERAREARRRLKCYSVMVGAIREWEELAEEEAESMAYGQAGDGARVKTSSLSDPSARAAVKAVSEPPSISEARAWCRAISDAWAEMDSCDRDTATVFAAYFQLHRQQSGLAWDFRKVSKTMVENCADLNICQSSFYRKLDDAVDTVMFHAARAGCYPER